AEPSEASVPGVRGPLEGARLALGKREARLEDRRRRGERTPADRLTVGTVAVVNHQRRLRDLVSQRSALAAADEWKWDHGFTSRRLPTGCQRSPQAGPRQPSTTGGVLPAGRLLMERARDMRGGGLEAG